MNSIVAIERGEIRTTTLAISEGAEVQHKNIIGLVRKYQEDLCEFGLVAFQTRLNKQGSSTEYATLNEPQAALVMTYLKNTPIVREFKKRLLKEFYRMREALLNQQNLSWREERTKGKSARRVETDGIQRFVEYAIGQGSQNAKKYFTSITTMTNKALFMVSATGPQSFRDTLDAMQLSCLTVAEYLVREVLEDGMRAGLHYKDIYVLARDKVTAYAATLPKLRLLSA